MDFFYSCLEKVIVIAYYQVNIILGVSWKLKFKEFWDQVDRRPFNASRRLLIFPSEGFNYFKSDS